MKFGELFRQQSVPEWSTHNLDYNDLKELIKRRTSKGIGQAQTIPGKENEAHVLQAFEDELFGELVDQHGRIHLFVYSKSGEVGRKLADLQRQIQLLHQRVHSGGHKISYRQLEAFSKLEDQTLAAGEEIRALKQFAAANREAFRKLLKKYTKWTGSPGLTQRVNRDVLNRQSAIAHWNFETLLAQHINTLAGIREALNPSVRPLLETARRDQTKKISSISSRPAAAPDKHDRLGRASHESVAAYLDSIGHGVSHVELDAALATAPLGQGGQRTIYWVHPEHLVEVQVIILRHAALRASITSPASTKSTNSSISSRPTSGRGHKVSLNAGGVEIGLIVCDDLKNFTARQNNAGAGKSSTSDNDPPQKGAACIRYSPSQEILLAVDPGSERIAQSLTWPRYGRIRLAKLRRINRSCPIFDSSSEEDCPLNDESTQSQEAYKWLARHQGIQPLVQLRCKRAQFTGLRNNKDAGLWITLDTEIRMSDCNKDSIKFKDDRHMTMLGGTKEYWESFPHAVLEIRVEGGYPTSLCDFLNRSRLALPVEGFSLETHAVVSLCRPSDLRAPHWLSLVKQDIYSLPRTTTTTTTALDHPSEITFFKRNTPQETISDPSTRNDISSGFSHAPGESSNTSVPDAHFSKETNANKRKRRMPKRRILPSKDLLDRQLQPTGGYWNEFDNGSEAEAEPGYTILVDPNDADFFPGTAIIVRFVATFSEKIRSSTGKAYVWITSTSVKKISDSGERQPLFDNVVRSPNSEESSDSENDLPKRKYSTVPSYERPHPVNRKDVILFRTSVGCLTSSTVLVVVAIILFATSQKHMAVLIDVGLPVAVSSSIIFAILGAGCMLARHDKLGWLHYSILVSLLILIVLVNAILLYGVG